MDTILLDRITATQKFREILGKSIPANIFRVEGDEKMGKSRLLREFQKIAQEEFKADCVLIYLPSLIGENEDLFQFITQKVNIDFSNYKNIHNSQDQASINVTGVNQLFSTIEIQKSESKRTQDLFLRKIINAFLEDLQLASHSHLVLMFDAFEQADLDTQKWVNEKIVTIFSQLANVTLILSGRQLPDTISVWEGQQYSLRIDAPKIEDYYEFCKKMDDDFSEELIKAFYKVYKGNPGLFIESYNAFIE